MTRPLVPLMLAAGSVLGCSVGLGELSPSELAVNSCDDDSACYHGRCENHVCQATGGELTSLLIGITPSGIAPGAASFTYYKEVPAGGGELDPQEPLDIRVARAIESEGTVSLEFSDECVPSFDLGQQQSLPASPLGRIPAEVTFTPSQRVLGIPTESYKSDLGSDRYSFRANVPPGTYDVYIRPPFEPSPTITELCQQVPPRLFLNKEVTTGLDFSLTAASLFDLSIEWPLVFGPDNKPLDPIPLAGWTVDLVEPARGRPISRPQVLGEPATSDSKATYKTTLIYSPIFVSEPGSSKPKPMAIDRELIRLTPPEGVTAPILYAEVSGAQVVNPASIELTSPLPMPVNVTFSTTLAEDATPVPATVTLTAISLDGVMGLSTAFSRSVDVGLTGSDSVSLLPGHYRVVASPKTDCALGYCLATTVTEWVVAPTPTDQAGKAVIFYPSSHVEGYATVASGEPAAGASVRALASPLPIDNSSVLDAGNAMTAWQPKTTAGLVESGGSFSFDADPGSFTVRIEPDPTTGFGWLVNPNVNVPLAEELRLSVPLPVTYHGTVLVDDGMGTPASGALVRAFVYMKNGVVSPELVDGAVALQVAETHADEMGSYTLLVPRILGSD